MSEYTNNVLRMIDQLREQVADLFRADREHDEQGVEVRYPIEELGEDYDDGTMEGNVETLADAVVGHKIVKTEQREFTGPTTGYSWRNSGLVITLDNGTEVRLADTSDCCAYTDLESFLLHPEKVDHVIIGVGTTEGYTKWHIYADWGDVLELEVGWSCGNPFYYGYGFEINVVPLKAET